MAFNEKLRTPDIVEILDAKILTSSAHPDIMVIANEKYDEVLEKLSLGSLSEGQKAAIDNTASSPSSSNPVVLKLDVPVYYGVEDLGEIKDAVSVFGDLPIAVSPTADITSGSTTISNVSSMSSVVPQELVSGPGIPSNAYVVSVGVNTFEINIPATATGLSVPISVSPAAGDMRPVLTERKIYRWNGSSWLLFIETGTLDHTQLVNQNGDSNYQHLTLAEKNTLTSGDHIHGFEFLPSDVDATLDVINANPYGLLNDCPVSFFSLGTLPGGLSSEPVIYYVVGATPSSFQVSTTIGGSAVDITSQGSGTHILSVLPMLDMIGSAGSGIILSDLERSRLPTADQKDALQGTAGTPAASNRYVTNQDPRLNTLRNAYVTVGVATPACTYPGNEVTAFTAAIEGVSSFPCSVNLGNPAVVSAFHIYQDGDRVKFIAPSGSTSGALTASSTSVTDVTLMSVVSVGQTVSGSGIPPGTTVASLGLNSFVLSNAATVTASNVTLQLSSTLPGGIDLREEYYVRNSTPLQFNISSLPLGPLVATTSPNQGTILVGGNNQQAKAIEVLPASYTMYSMVTDNITWSIQNNSLLIECITPGGATLAWKTFTDSLAVLPPGAGPVTVRGLTFTLDGLGTSGIRLERDRCSIEDCNFVGLSPLSDNHFGVTVVGKNCRIDRCSFSDYLLVALNIIGEECLVQDCSFDLSNSTSYAISVGGTAHNAKIVGCRFNNCTINIAGGARNTQLRGNVVDTAVSIFDAGLNTAYLQLPSSSAQSVYGQAFVGKKRTVGRATSRADFRGDSEAVFALALNDPSVDELEVLEGTYTFFSTLSVPNGKKLRGVVPTTEVKFQGTPGVPILTLGYDSLIENLVLEADLAPAVTIMAFANVEISRCSISCLATNTPDDRCVEMSSVMDVWIHDCSFYGVAGVRAANSERVRLSSNVFNTTPNALETDALCEDFHIRDNHFLSGSLSISGQRFIVLGNHFLGPVPSKLGTTESVWRSNYPSPQTNNLEGVDYAHLSFSQSLSPRTPGCSHGEVLNSGALVFSKAGDGSAIAPAFPLGCQVDLASGFDVTLGWTSDATSGSVRWQVTVVFLDDVGSVIGTPSTLTANSLRTYLSETEQDEVVFSFPATYGLGVGVQPTHVSIEVTRLPLDPADTLPKEVFLIATDLQVRRD